MASLYQNDSFFTGRFFGGEFLKRAPRGQIAFAHRAWGTPKDHTARTRGKFQLPITVDELIQTLAARHLDDGDALLVHALRGELTQRYIDWRDSYIDDLLRERDRLLAKRAAEERHAALERAQWLERRGQSMKRAH
jgi:hypothetical protein